MKIIIIGGVAGGATTAARAGMRTASLQARDWPVQAQGHSLSRLGTDPCRHEDSGSRILLHS